MSFVDCKLETNLQSFPLITDGAVPAYLVNHITLPTSDSNNQASFIWKVFSIGRTNQITVTCDMEVLHTDECVIGTHNCDENAACSDTDSGFTCACNDGYEGDGVECTSTSSSSSGDSSQASHTCTPESASCCEVDGTQYSRPSASYSCHKTNFGIVVARIQPSPSTWSDALADCKNDGSHVHQPIPKSDEESQWYADFVFNEFSKFPSWNPTDVYFWLGVNDAVVNGEYRDDKDEVQSYFKWGPSQPQAGSHYVYMITGSYLWGVSSTDSSELTGFCTYLIDTSD